MSADYDDHMMSLEEAEGREDKRFYEEKYPEPEQLVMVRIKEIAEMGAYASLLEYNGIQGLIQLSELSKRRFRSVQKLVKVNRCEVVMVLRVDKEKGYIDMSKRRVSHEDIANCEDRFSKSKKVFQTVSYIADKYKLNLREINTKIIWPLYKKANHALDILKDQNTDLRDLFGPLDLDEETLGQIMRDVKDRLSPQMLKIRVNIQVSCLGYDGIDAVKSSLLAGVAAFNQLLPKDQFDTTADLEHADDFADDTKKDAKESISVRLIAAPNYLVVTSCYDKIEGIERIEKAIKVIDDSIKKYKGGEFNQPGEIQVIGGDEDKRYAEDEDQDETSSEEDEEEAEEEEGMGLAE